MSKEKEKVGENLVTKDEKEDVRTRDIERRNEDTQNKDVDGQESLLGVKEKLIMNLNIF